MWICVTTCCQIDGAKEANRNPNETQVMAAAPVWVSDDISRGRLQTKWFPALVGNHIADLVRRYDDGSLPKELTSYIKGRQGYNYLEHANTAAKHLDFVTDEVIDRFCVIGTPEDHIRRIEDLKKAAGINQFNIYLMSGNEEETVFEYGKNIIPYINKLG